jgi:hypothetical protein
VVLKKKSNKFYFIDLLDKENIPRSESEDKKSDKKVNVENYALSEFYNCLDV